MRSGNSIAGAVCGDGPRRPDRGAYVGKRRTGLLGPLDQRSPGIRDGRRIGLHVTGVVGDEEARRRSAHLARGRDVVRCRRVPAQPGLRLTGLGGDSLPRPATGSAVADVGGDAGVTQAGGDVSRTLLRPCCSAAWTATAGAEQGRCADPGQRPGGEVRAARESPTAGRASTASSRRKAASRPRDTMAVSTEAPVGWPSG